jgi:predicted Rdx family selenoprotein
MEHTDFYTNLTSLSWQSIKEDILNLKLTFMQIFRYALFCLGPPNVTLMKTTYTVWCIAQGDAANSALVWTKKEYGFYPEGKHIRHRVFSYVPSEVTG